MIQVGLDVAAHVAPVLESGLGERYASDQRYLRLVNDNKQFLGKKTGSGFYTYDSKGRQVSNAQWSKVCCIPNPGL